VLEGREHSFARARTERAADVDLEPLMRERLRVGARQRREGGGADCVYVAHRHRAALELLGRHVADRPYDGARSFARHQLAHGAEVDEDVRAVRAPHDVARLHVTMHDR